MSDAEELQAKIAALAGRINRHKNASDVQPIPHHAPGRTKIDSRSTAIMLNKQDYGYAPTYGAQHWAYQRGTPYGAPRGRGGYAAAKPAPHRHRSLILNVPGQAQAPVTHVPTSAPVDPTSETGAGWVTKRDRHMQLINTNVYEQKTQERTQAIEETRRQKQKAREDREKAKLQTHLHALAAYNQPTAQATHLTATPAQIIVNDIRYLVTDGGSKLVKVKDDLNNLKTTPRRATIGGITFVRSKHGNLYRAGLIKTMRRNTVKKIQQPCPQFSTTGTCSKGPQCRYVHDPTKVAICLDFLRTGQCQAGLDCDLSHDPTPERVPACLHFLRGNCTKDDCRYAHVRVNPGAPVCRAFATLGYCSKGAACPERHVHECPDYANKGLCRNKNCRLPHVDRAGQLRKAAAAKEDGRNSSETASDISSDEEDAEYDDDDVDSDEFDEEYLIPSGAAAHELSQQTDFVKF